MSTLGISFELFPPKTEQGQRDLPQTCRQLSRFQPDFFSVTFGAGGSKRERTWQTILELQKAVAIPAIPHLSCMGSSKAGISQLLSRYQQAGISRLVVLRGDIPLADPACVREFQYASELVEFIRLETGEHFYIEVAAYPEGHPESPSAQADLYHFKQKVQAGVNGAITQYFFNIDAYLDFIDRVQQLGINIPITPGIMPITNYRQLAGFSKRCGAEIPRWLNQRLQDFADDLPSIRDFGIDFITRLCERLVHEGAPGLHFYTLNQSAASTAILKRLNRPY